MRVKVKVKTGSGKNEVNETEKDCFDVKVTVQPEKGKANEKVIELLSKHLKVPKSRITIVSGQTYKEKVIEIS